MSQETHPTASSSTHPEINFNSISAEKTSGIQDQLLQTFGTFKAYFDGVVNDALRPSISNLLKTCQANQQAEALLATPLLLGSLIFIATFVSLTSLLIVFKTVGLIFKLVIFAIAATASILAWMVTILVVTAIISGFSTILFVGINLLIAVLSEKMQARSQERHRPFENLMHAKDGLLAVVDVGKQNMQMSTTVFVQVWKAIWQLVLNFSSSIQKTNVSLQNHQAVSITSPRKMEKMKNDVLDVDSSHSEQVDSLLIGDESNENLEVHPSIEGLRRRG